MTAATDEQRRQAREAAVIWLLRLAGGPASPETLAEFDAWLQESALHGEAYGKAEAAFVESRPAHTPVRILGAGRRIVGETRATRVRRLAMVATLLAAGIAGFWFFQAPGDGTYRTAAGQTRRLALPDGSVVELNGATTLSVRLAPDVRDIVLSQGQALFNVAKDPARPFRVHAGDRTIQAVGTSFDVEHSDTAVEVVVAEGAVVVSDRGVQAPPTTGTSDSATLQPGQAVTYRPAAPLSRPRQVPATSVGSWRQKMLSYEDAPLSLVIASLSRYYPGTYRLDDPKLADFRVTITNYPIRDLATTIRYFEQSHALRAVAKDNGQTVFLPRGR
jgi:transmembrane sensor